MSKILEILSKTVVKPSKKIPKIVVRKVSANDKSRTAQAVKNGVPKSTACGVAGTTQGLFQGFKTTKFKGETTVYYTPGLVETAVRGIRHAYRISDKKIRTSAITQIRKNLAEVEREIALDTKIKSTYAHEALNQIARL